MRVRVAVSLLLLAPGILFIALPDSGPRLVSLSEAHGPSALDAVGILLVLVGWAYLAWPLRAGWDRLPRHSARFVLAVFAAGLGAGLVVASVLGDFGAWWVVGAVLLALVQLTGLVAVTR